MGKLESFEFGYWRFEVGEDGEHIVVHNTEWPDAVYEFDRDSHGWINTRKKNAEYIYNQLSSDAEKIMAKVRGSPRCEKCGQELPKCKDEC